MKIGGFLHYRKNEEDISLEAELEGKYHNGKACVVPFVGKKISE
jgi:hypothetical protein